MLRRASPRSLRALAVAAALGLTPLGCGPSEETAREVPAQPARDEAAPAAPPDPSPDDPSSERGPDEAARRGEATRLRVPPALIHAARREALGLSRLTPALRAQTLEERRATPGPPYAALREDAEAHARARVSLRGRIGLLRPAGPRLWIVALLTRRTPEGWRDPLYVLSVVPAGEVTEGEEATVEGWVVGERTIGRHALPLVLAYALEPRPRDDEGVGPQPGGG